MRALHLGCDEQGLARLERAHRLPTRRPVTLADVRRELAALDEPVLLAFAGHASREAWRFPDGELGLTEIAAALGHHEALIVVDSCHAAALADHLHGPGSLVLLAACAAHQRAVELAESHFLGRVIELWPGCDDLDALETSLRSDAPDVEMPCVWTNRPGSRAAARLTWPKGTGAA